MQDSRVSLSQECFNEHIQSAAFHQGVERGWWGIEPLEGITWPHVLIWIAAPPRANSPDRYYFRFILEDYPEKGPTATPWDPKQNTQAPPTQRPKGIGDAQIALRTDWEHGRALYVPWDRVAMDSHSDWPPKFPGLGWKRTYTIVHYLRLTHELLATEEYHGT